MDYSSEYRSTEIDTTFKDIDLDPLKIDLPDDTFIDVVKDWTKKAREHFGKQRIRERQRKNVDYLFGQQLNTTDLEDESRYMDNVIKESEDTIKPIALSRLPDLTVTPSNDEPESVRVAKDLSKILTSDLKTRENRKVLDLAHRHLPAYLTAVIKVVWDVEVEDYKFINIHPENITFDPTCKTNNPDDMQVIIERYMLSVKEIVMRFPQKEEDIYRELGISIQDRIAEENLATPYEVEEVWFTWFSRKGAEWEKIEGVGWKLQNLTLGVMKNPNFDYEGYEETFRYDTDSKQKKGYSTDQLKEMLLSLGIQPNETSDDIETQTIFRNYFDCPRKPYIIMGYDQWGDSPYDKTSRIEQNIILQDNVNKRGRQITDMADRAIGRDIFTKDSGLKKEDIEEFNSDPKVSLLIDGDVSSVHTHVQADQPSQALFQDQNINRDKIFSKAGTHDTTRGQKESDTATTSQILREADYGRIDDLVEVTINAAAEQMARWAMQFIKLRYDAEKFRKLIGSDGETVFMKLRNDMIENGMEVVVSASSTDKAKQERIAIQRAQMQMIDPLSLFEALEVPNPKEQTKRLMLFTSMPQQYMAEYVMGLPDAQSQANTLGQTPVDVPVGGAPVSSGNQAPQIQPPSNVASQGQAPQPAQMV